MANWDDLFAAIGYGGIRAGYVIQRIKDRFKEDFASEEKTAAFRKPSGDKTRSVHIQGNVDLAVKFAHCCMPVPGDNIIGYITRGRGVTIHRADCINIKNSNEKDRLIEVSWLDETNTGSEFIAKLTLNANDRNGIIADVALAISNEGISISALKTKTPEEGLAKMNIDVIVNTTKQVDNLVKKLENIKGVLSIYRN